MDSKRTETVATDSNGLVCGCRKCLRDRKEMICGLPAEMCRMIVCEHCGNKRCPHANDHNYTCTGSNELGQLGSAWEHVKPPTPMGEPISSVEWRDVKTNEPPILELKLGQGYGEKPYVLVIDEQGRMSIAYARRYSSVIHWTMAKQIGAVTHWMPLPDPPNAKDYINKSLT